ncbi:MAG: hypothetical protein PHF21_04230, partial [Bacilli bacterium]|nr:hypothetical protein [Bacilli bacterium]
MLILNNDCSSNIKIEYRKKVFDYFFAKKKKIDNDSDIELIEFAIVNCRVVNKKVDINLIKLGQRFYEEKKEYKNMLKWL